ncbi:MAG TPA: DUF115 domain-containing protein, partial [Spirochaetota bacterium]|nr:DUF115 domain-containing protein [Spirochaetota bacterium]
MPAYIVSDSRSGVKTLSVKTDGNEREIRIHSAYDPVKEAERSIEYFNPGRNSVIIVSGIGLGYHVHLLKKKFHDKKIIAVENDPELTAICRSVNSPALDDVYVIHDETDIQILFDNFRMSGFTGISHYIHRPSYQMNPGFYDSTISIVKQQISSKVSDLLTRFEFEERWMGNIFMNLRHMEDSLPVSALFGKFTGYPGIIVSAGPSLRRNLDAIKKISDRAVILCVDTSYKVLTKAGITPHLVMTLDAQKYSRKHFTGTHAGDSLLVADIVACPSVMNNFDGKKIISTTSKYYQDTTGSTVRETTPAMDWIEKYITSPGDVQSGGSVATSAFDLLLNMGCDPIILTGQDLAYTGREYHCSGTYHNDDWQVLTGRFRGLDTINQNLIRKRRIKYVPSFGGNGMVISDFVFDLYKFWFEDSAARVKVKVVNATGGGSRISNTIEADLEQTVSAVNVKIPPADILRRITQTPSGTDTRSLKKAVRR